MRPEFTSLAPYLDRSIIALPPESLKPEHVAGRASRCYYAGHIQRFGSLAMLSKFLLTLAIITAAFFIVRQRSLAEAEENSRRKKPATEKPKQLPKDDSLSSDLRIAAYMFLVLMVGLGATLYYYDWQDDHKILTVTLHRENQAQPVVYEVYKYQLQDRSFITVDGTSVTVAGSERMEVQGLEP